MNILIIDDHPLFIDGISRVIESLNEPTNIIKATSGAVALEQLASEVEFDLILLDLNMPNLDGISLLKHFKVDELCVPVVIISSEDQAQLIQETLDWGVMGFIPKSYSSKEILNAINKVLDGDIYIPEAMKILLTRLAQSSTQNDKNTVIQNTGISKKQMDVLNLIAKGYSNKQISTVLHRTEHTVKSHVAALFQILGASNRMECVKIAERKGVIGN